MEKFNLSEVSNEESQLFMKEFGELLEKHSLYFEPVPQFTREGLVQPDGKPYPWKIVTQILLQKKTSIVEPRGEDEANDPHAIIN